jgi:hypothetical protein
MIRAANTWEMCSNGPDHLDQTRGGAAGFPPHTYAWTE